jgi:uncharacterized delta-60 repeat protein
MNRILLFFLFSGFVGFSQSQIAGRLDPTLEIGTGFEDMMDAVLVQPDGKIIVAGQGDQYQGVGINRIIRLNADGTVDNTFSGPELLIYENYNEMELQPDGKILTLSHYTNDPASTSLIHNFKRLNTDGSIDATFNAGGTGVVETTTSRITEMAVLPDGKIIVAGAFTHYNGVPSKNIARLNADGTLDATFVVGTGFNSSVYGIALQADGKVLVVGDFTFYNGAIANKFIRLNADGSKDTSFTPATPLVGKVVEMPNGNLFIIGSFTTISGEPRSKIAILNPNGTLFDDGVIPAGPTSASNDGLLAIMPLPDNKILVGGWFTQWGGQTVRHIVRLNPNGSRDLTFSPNNGPNYMVWDMAQYPDNRYIVSGGFATYDGQPRASLARIYGVSNVPPPTGNASQTICGSGTLASLSVTQAPFAFILKWYDAPTGGNLLPSSTPLVSGTTYYATQTEANSESATRLAVTVTLATQSTPTFTQVGPFCTSTTIGYTLPTTSNNGVTGTWSPSWSADTSRVYTFTPAAGQCATTTTMSVTINQNVNPTFTQIPAICTGANLVLPTTSNNGITGTWSPAVNNQQTTTYTFLPDSGQCSWGSMMTVTVNPGTVPAFTQVASICSGATLAPLPTTSTNGVTGTWSPALNNTATTTYTFTPTSGQCASAATMTISVTPNTAPAFTQVASICLGSTLAALPTTSTNGVAGTWSPALDNTATTTYTFTPSAGQCASPSTMTISVTPNTAPAFTQVASICSGSTLAALPTTSTNGVTGTWSPALNNTATTTYTFTPSAGQCASPATMTISVTPNTAPAFTQVASICSGSTLAALPTTSTNGVAGTWSPALNNTATTTYTFTPSSGECASPATMTISVTPNTAPAFTQVASICSGSTLAALPTTSTNGVTGTWSPALNNTATTTYTFTPSAGQCASPSTMTISVTPNTAPAFTQVASICSGETLAALPTTSTNGVTGTWSPALNNTATTTYTFTPSSGQCASPATMTIAVTVTDAPEGLANQQILMDFAEVATLADIEVDGNDITWYASLANAIGNINPLLLTTPITNGTTYYAMQVIDGCRSVEPLAVTVNVTLGSAEFGMRNIVAYPNPTMDYVQFTGLQEAAYAEVYDISGRKIQGLNVDAVSGIDFGRLPAAVYFIKLTVGNDNKIFRIVKQ